MESPSFLHPWYGIEYKERIAAAAEFRQWLSENPELRLKPGTVRADGKVFASYQVTYQNGEYWTDAETLQKRRDYSKVKMRAKRNNDPDFNRRFKEYIKTRYPNIEMRRKKTNERGKRWREANKARNAQKSRFRYALKRSRVHPELNRPAELALFAEAARLTRETGTEHHVDHIIPLKHGGWHHHLNMQVLPDRLNYEKSFDPLWEKAGYKSWRDVPEHLWPEEMAPVYRERILRSA